MNALPVPASSQWTARRTCISGTNLIARPQRGAAARQSPPRLCRAAAEKEGTKQDSKLQVPDAAPAGSKPSVSQEQIPTDDSASSGSFSDEQRLTADEIGAQIGQLRAANKENEKKEGMLDGVLEQVALISWPSPQGALLNTFLVIAIVGGTSAVLFGVNTLLAEASRVVYNAL